MTFERVTAGGGIGAEPAPVPRQGESVSTGAVSPAMRLQILSTEHWSLLASRSLAWNESFSRAGMFLSTLSGAIVALGLVGGASGFGEAFIVLGAAYLELAPDLERYFVMSAHDDFRGIGVTMGVQPGGGRAFWLAQILAGTPTIVTILNSVLAGAIAAIAALRIGGAPSTILLVGAVGFLIVLVAHWLYTRQGIAKLQAGLHPMFPSPEGD